MITNWGYTLTGVESLADMLEYLDFDTFTGGKYAGEQERAQKEISAASAAIRNFVGWHLYPALDCELSTFMLDRRVTPVGSDLLIQLPARAVNSIASVTIGGIERTDFFCDQNGLLRVFDVGPLDRRALVMVDYNAGLPAEMMAPVQELIADRVKHALAVPEGITSEASGGVSVTYNAAWINNTKATSLMGDNKELLIPYKVQGVF